jgi:hypothetical protein
MHKSSPLTCSPTELLPTAPKPENKRKLAKKQKHKRVNSNLHHRRNSISTTVTQSPPPSKLNLHHRRSQPPSKRVFSPFPTSTTTGNKLSPPETVFMTVIQLVTVVQLNNTVVHHRIHHRRPTPILPFSTLLVACLSSIFVGSVSSFLSNFPNPKLQDDKVVAFLDINPSAFSYFQFIIIGFCINFIIFNFN